MKIFLSGVISNANELRNIDALSYYKDVMLSYFYIKKHNISRIFDFVDKNRLNIFLDSGAFSALNTKHHIDIDEYISFVRLYKSSLFAYSNLDVIGDTKKTELNQQHMEEQGLFPIPVYHWGDSERVFFDLCERYNFVSIGATVPIKNKKNLALKIREIIRSIDYNNTKIHLFGFTSLTGLRILNPYIYSTDSTVWIRRAMYKERILIPKGRIIEPNKSRMEIANDNILALKRFTEELQNERSQDIFGILHEKEKRNSNKS